MDLATSTVAVTGATGFIGRYIVRALLDRGARVIGVVRNPDKVPGLREAGVELRKADLADRDALADGFEGADAVIANAAVISLGDKSREQLIRANVEGTRNVFEAMSDAGVGRAVQTSSAVVYAPKRGHFYREGDPLRDRSARSNRLSHYAVSKAIGEREAWRLADELGIALSTARPHTVYGAHDRTGFTFWFKRFMKPRFSVFPTRLNFPSVYAGDLADAMCRMLERDVAAGRAYNVSGDPDGWDYWDHVDAYRRAGGDAPRLVVPIPVPLRRRYSIERARVDLGFANRPLVDGFREMLELERRGP